MEKLTDLTYRIQKDENTPSLVVHVDHLKPYAGNNPPENWLLTQTQTEHGIIFNEDENVTDTSLIPANTSTPKTRTRTGRIVKPREIYSP